MRLKARNGKIVTITEEELEDMVSDSVCPSFCKSCGDYDDVDCVEPDARNYKCFQCERHTRNSVLVELGFQ